jgi:hypothetical protein
VDFANMMLNYGVRVERRRLHHWMLPSCQDNNHQAVEERDSLDEWTDAVSDETKTLDSDDAHIGQCYCRWGECSSKGGDGTLTLQLTYYPSSDEKRDALYNKLNEVSKRKVAAIESLRKSAGIVSCARAAEEEAEGAVKSGFLNRPRLMMTASHCRLLRPF